VEGGELEAGRADEAVRAAGAKYFTALANHHDNFDNYNSRFHNWNSVKIGPKKDIVGIYAGWRGSMGCALR